MAVGGAEEEEGQHGSTRHTDFFPGLLDRLRHGCQDVKALDDQRLTSLFYLESVSVMGGAVPPFDEEGEGSAPYLRAGRQLSATDVVAHYRQGISLLRRVHEPMGLQEHEARTLLDKIRWDGERLGEVLNDKAVIELRQEIGCLKRPPPGTNAEGLMCPIELEAQTADSGIVLPCGHCFSRTALSSYIVTAVQESQVPVRCPLHVSGCLLIFSWEETIELGCDGASCWDRCFSMLCMKPKLEEVLTSTLASRIAPSIGLRQCTSCPSFLHPLNPASDWPHLTCLSCHTSFCGHCSRPPHLPLPCTHARMHDEWLAFLHRMTQSARELAEDPSKKARTPLSPTLQAMLNSFRARLDHLGGGTPDAGSGAASSSSSSSSKDPTQQDDDSSSSLDTTAAMEESAEPPAPDAGPPAAMEREYDLRSETKPCPACGEPYEKNAGCSHFTCKKCGWQFCWVCSKPWKNHGVCAKLDVDTYRFDEEMEWYMKKQHGGSSDQQHAAAGGGGGSSIYDIEMIKDRRRQQLREMQQHYIGRAERENQSMADLRYRRLPQDALGHFLANYEQMGTALLQGMRAAKTCIRPNYENVAMTSGVTARSMRRVQGVRPVAAMLERGALAFMAIDEHRGGLPPERLHAHLERVRWTMSLEGLPGPLAGMQELSSMVMQKVAAVERMAAIIMAKEGGGAAPRTTTATTTQGGEEGAEEGGRSVADSEVTAYLKQGAGTVAEHFDVLLTWAQAWAGVARLVLTHWDQFMQVRTRSLADAMMMMEEEGGAARRHPPPGEEEAAAAYHHREHQQGLGPVLLPPHPRAELLGMRQVMMMREMRMRSREMDRYRPPPPAPLADARGGGGGGGYRGVGRASQTVESAAAAAPSANGGGGGAGGAGGAAAGSSSRGGGGSRTATTARAAAAVSTTTTTTTTTMASTGTMTAMVMDDPDWELMGRFDDEFHDEMAMLMEDIDARRGHNPYPPHRHHHHLHMAMPMDVPLTAPRHFLETFEQSVSESEQVDDATKREFSLVFGDAWVPEDGRRARAAITEAKNRRKFAIERIVESVVMRRLQKEGAMGNPSRRETVREECLTAITRHFDRRQPALSSSTSVVKQQSQQSGILSQQQQKHQKKKKQHHQHGEQQQQSPPLLLLPEDDDGLEYFRIYEVFIHLGLLPAPSMEDDLPARLAYINLIKASDARRRVMKWVLESAAQQQQEEHEQQQREQAAAGQREGGGHGNNDGGATTTTSSSSSCSGKRTFDSRWPMTPSVKEARREEEAERRRTRKMMMVAGMVMEEGQRREEMLTLLYFMQRQEEEGGGGAATTTSTS